MRSRYGLVEIDGQVITTRNLSDSVGAIVRRLGEMKSFLVCTLNLDHLVKLRSDPRFRDAIADFLVREQSAVEAYAEDIALHVPFRRP